MAELPGSVVLLLRDGDTEPRVAFVAVRGADGSEVRLAIRPAVD